MLEPLVDGKQIQFVGEADQRMKRELYEKAYCLVLPLRWEEPFGLVMAEAMACGTPVVAFRRGAAAEIIVDGETGYLVDDLDEMVEAVRKIDRIDPRRCRRHIEANFSPSHMAEGYLRVYQQIIRQARASRRSLPSRRNFVASRMRDERRDGGSLGRLRAYAHWLKALRRARMNTLPAGRAEAGNSPARPSTCR